MGQASIVRMANGKFAAVFGNGYNSVSQTAVLYIVDIKTGHLIRSITTGVGDTTQQLMAWQRRLRLTPMATILLMPFMRAIIWAICGSLMSATGILITGM